MPSAAKKMLFSGALSMACRAASSGRAATWVVEVHVARVEDDDLELRPERAELLDEVLDLLDHLALGGVVVAVGACRRQEAGRCCIW